LLIAASSRDVSDDAVLEADALCDSACSAAAALSAAKLRTGANNLGVASRHGSCALARAADASTALALSSGAAAPERTAVSARRSIILRKRESSSYLYHVQIGYNMQNSGDHSHIKFSAQIARISTNAH
jgi:hypothetical protein